MQQHKSGIRFSIFFALALALTLSLALAACGADPTPTPTPTATPVPPTATPAPTPTPMPTPTPESEATMEGFFMTQATTGKDLFDRLSQEENDCLKTQFGEQIYGFMLNTPLLMQGGDPSSAGPLFGCLTTDNAVMFGVAILDAQSGGWSPETRACIVEIGLEHPDAVFIRMGMTVGTGPDAPAETMDFNVQIHECKNDDEKKAFTLALWIGIDSISAGTGQDIYDLLSEEEAQCVSDGLSDKEFAAMMAATPLEAVQVGTSVSQCIDPETNLKIFANGIQWGIGGVREETLTCLQEFGRQNPAFVALLASGIDGIRAMPADEFLRVSAAGNEQYACMTDEEQLRIQEAAADAMSAGP